MYFCLYWERLETKVVEMEKKLEMWWLNWLRSVGATSLQHSSSRFDAGFPHSQSPEGQQEQ
jgi:hypothetical protein